MQEVFTVFFLSTRGKAFYILHFLAENRMSNRKQKKNAPCFQDNGAGRFTERKKLLKLLIADSISDSTFGQRRKSWKNFDRQVPLHLLRLHLKRSLPQFARVVAQRLAFKLTNGSCELEVKTPFEMHKLGQKAWADEKRDRQDQMSLF